MLQMYLFFFLTFVIKVPNDGSDEPQHAAHCFVSLNCYFDGIPCLHFTYVQCFHFVSCSCRLSENGRL